MGFTFFKIEYSELKKKSVFKVFEQSLQIDSRAIANLFL